MRLTRGSGNLQEFGNMILNANPQETARFPKEYGKGRSWGQPQYSRFRQDQSLRIQWLFSDFKAPLHIFPFS